MQVAPGRFLLVELEEGMHPNRASAFMHSWQELTGVTRIVDLAIISQATLDCILMLPTPVVEREEPTIYNAIRRYWQRKRQPRLFEEAS